MEKGAISGIHRKVKSKSGELLDGLFSGAMFESQGAEEMFGYTSEEASGERIDQLVMPDKYAKQFRKAFSEFQKTGNGKALRKPIEAVALRKDGTTFPIELTYSSFQVANNYQLVAIIRDITERKETVQQLKEQRKELSQLHNAVDILQQQDSEEELLETTVTVAVEILGFNVCTIGIVKCDYLEPKACSSGLDFDAVRRFRIDEGIAGKTVEKGKTIWGDDLRKHPASKQTKEGFRAFISVPIGEIGNLQVISKETGSFDERDVELAEILGGHLREALKRVKLEEELNEKAIRDPLTEVYNRRYFEETLSEELSRAKRYREFITFVMVDINGFKRINDHYSHRSVIKS